MYNKCIWDDPHNLFIKLYGERKNGIDIKCLA